MKLAHFYDHTYYRKNNQHFSSGAFSVNSWERYLRVFDTVSIVANLKEGADLNTNQLNAVDAERVNFIFVPNARNPIHFGKYILGAYNNKLESIIENHDAIAVRLPSELGLFVVDLAERMQKPYAIEVVGCNWDSYWNHGSLKGKIMAPFAYARMKRALHKTDHAIYVTQKFLQERYPSSGFNASASNVCISIDDRAHDVLVHRKRRIEEFSPPYHIGLIGSMDVRYKGHYELIMSLAQCQDVDFRVHFVGPGQQKWLDTLAAKYGIQDRLVYHGKLPAGKPIIDFLDKLDIYVHPSRQEGLPRTVIEAMSRALPILASTIAGIPELLPDKYLHTPGDIHELTALLKAYFTSSTIEKLTMVEINFNRAKDFNDPILIATRHRFWKHFAEQINT